MSEAELAQLEASLGDETGGSSVPESVTSVLMATPPADKLKVGQAEAGKDAKSAGISSRLPTLQRKSSNPLSDLAEAAIASTSA